MGSLRTLDRQKNLEFKKIFRGHDVYLEEEGQIPESGMTCDFVEWSYYVYYTHIYIQEPEVRFIKEASIENIKSWTRILSKKM